MSWRSRVQINTVALSLATLLGIFALGFAGFAVYLALLVHYPPNIAAVITAGGYALAAILVILIAKFAVYRTKIASPAIPKDKTPNVDDIENILQAVITPAVSKMIHQHPGKSVMATLLAGLFVGYNEETRNAAKNVFKRFFDEK
ncbi:MULTISPECIES: phage holin family protein [unclassified Methylophaga]|jgi:hypothetical protein|uniref:phage holin family protein n=1 Tax=unclassified Methylophaga TaxID=2629249 RepID=UPI000C8ADF41|nr:MULTISPECIES: phage holin family protein [unclassified Methylophaga]MAK66059.1 hypothetical protein [Methylophaga sp.]MAY17255.1 hypothetical protein [Methylophaga sp.]MBN45685.1 hypothetical protein [Methylophaga sp.]HAO25909.1 hypothetical protein [Methylophaga sp.]HCD04190.1 hypothetical protein [Methylophaga sp.]|tara:strand:- start:70335 stop:70769 length:435 start_codon:yes stop_codon:yes gene_type:complete